MSATTNRQDAQCDRELERILKMSDEEVLASMTTEDWESLELTRQWLLDNYGLDCPGLRRPPPPVRKREAT